MDWHLVDIEVRNISLAELRQSFVDWYLWSVTYFTMGLVSSEGILQSV